MKKKGITIFLAAVLFCIAIFFKFPNHLMNDFFYFVSYLLVGGEILKKALRNILRGKIFDENFLMAIATIGAFCIGSLEEAVAVMLFYQVGEFFQDYAVDKSRKSIGNLMDIKPDYANLSFKKSFKKVHPKEVKIGDVIVVQPGEKIPLDGIVIEGNSSLDMKALTGEIIPKNVKIHDEVLSGCINLNGLLKVKVTKSFKESTVSKILDLVENASSRKSQSENFITKFAKYYTPVVVGIAFMIATVIPFLLKEDYFTWLYRALSFLVVSCPCALVISIPLSFFGGLGGASKMGILIKGSQYLEALSKVDTIVFDKTGTLTKGIFKVQKINPVGIDKKELLHITSLAENYSTHPIACAIKEAYHGSIDSSKIEDVKELSGYGIEAKIDKHKVLVGNQKLMKKHKISYQELKEIGTILYVAIDNQYKGSILIADSLKEDSKETVTQLKEEHMKKIVMLTGDQENVGKSIASRLKIDEVYTELLPQDKVSKIEELIQQEKEGRKVAFVGDGINDAPALAIADIGIAMGALGTDSAIEAADIVIMTDELKKIIQAIHLSHRTMNIVKENIIFAIFVKVSVLILVALGLSTMWEAVFADVGVSVIAILNALRILKVPKKTS